MVLPVLVTVDAPKTAKLLDLTVDPGRPDPGFSVIDDDVVVIRFVSIVTAPFSASNLPSTDAPVVAVIDASAIIVPLKLVPVPRVAELPTCQKTFEARAPLARTTLLLVAVTSVLPILKM